VIDAALIVALANAQAERRPTHARTAVRHDALADAASASELLKPFLDDSLDAQELVAVRALKRAVVPIEFITIILWESLDDVRAIQAQDYEKAVIPEDRLPRFTRYDARAVHDEVVSTNEPASTSPKPASWCPPICRSGLSVALAWAHAAST
jgi:hypothetical protein